MSSSTITLRGPAGSLTLVGASRELVVRGGTAVALVDMGRTGPQGPPGLPGAAAASYTHEQAVANSTWTIAHNLGWRPTVTVFSTGGLEVIAEVVHLSTDVAQVLFVEPMAGSARCT